VTDASVRLESLTYGLSQRQELEAMNPEVATDGADSLVAYYERLHFNPVLIEVENPAVWKAHFDKRRNLYERHLGLPLAFLRGASVLEFGPNSGENALLPALFGAHLTLVEPNQQVLPRLTDLFSRFGVGGQIESLTCAGIDGFKSERRYDLVVAEGFLYTLANRAELLAKIADFVRPGCFGVISFNDRCGGLLEYLRRAILFRACELEGVADVQSDACLDLASAFFKDDFAQLRSSRTFEAWWRDTLVNPFCRSAHMWSLPEVLDVLHAQGCEFHASSPAWLTSDRYTWYKNILAPEVRRQQLMAVWRQNLPYFLTGLTPTGAVQAAVTQDLVDDVSNLVTTLGDWEVRTDRAGVNLKFPASLDRYLTDSGDRRLHQANEEWQGLIAALGGHSLDGLRRAYHGAALTRQLWGTAYHYVCFQRSLEALVSGTAQPLRSCA
jgi:SAM-dependent methyltransferase